MPESSKIVIVTPVYNDWESFSILTDELLKIDLLYQFDIVAVNDGSVELYDQKKFNQNNLTILNLKANIGHQRAIAVGLQYVFDNLNDFQFVVVMDSDGEDVPSQIPLLIKKAENLKYKKIVFAQRNKRSETVAFRVGYFFYKKLFKFLTGQSISFGNFSVIPKQLLVKVVNQNHLWNHYSGSIIFAKIPFDTVLLNRGKRYRGTSKMNFNSLLLHGLSSIAVYFDYLSIKILRLTFMGILFCSLCIGIILFKKFVTETAIPGWASSLLLIITGIILQLFSVTLIVLLMQLSSRKNINAPNSSVYKKFINDIKKNKQP